MDHRLKCKSQTVAIYAPGGGGTVKLWVRQRLLKHKKHDSQKKKKVFNFTKIKTLLFENYC